MKEIIMRRRKEREREAVRKKREEEIAAKKVKKGGGKAAEAAAAKETLGRKNTTKAPPLKKLASAVKDKTVNSPNSTDAFVTQNTQKVQDTTMDMTKENSSLLSVSPDKTVNEDKISRMSVVEEGSIAVDQILEEGSEESESHKPTSNLGSGGREGGVSGLSKEKEEAAAKDSIQEKDQEEESEAAISRGEESPEQEGVNSKLSLQNDGSVPDLNAPDEKVEDGRDLVQEKMDDELKMEKTLDESINQRDPDFKAEGDQEQ